MVLYVEARIKKCSVYLFFIFIIIVIIIIRHLFVFPAPDVLKALFEDIAHMYGFDCSYALRLFFRGSGCINCTKILLRDLKIEFKDGKLQCKNTRAHNTDEG